MVGVWMEPVTAAVMIALRALPLPIVWLPFYAVPLAWPKRASSRLKSSIMPGRS